MKPFEFIVVPTSLGAPFRGAELGPYVLAHELHERAPLVKTLTGPQSTSQDWCGLHNYQAVSVWVDLVYQAVNHSLLMGTVPVVFAGDHSVAAGSISAVAGRRKKLAVIWFDAHSDANTPESSPTGNMHGIPLAWLLGHGPSKLPYNIQPYQVIQVGVRSVDQAEASFILRQDITVVRASDVHDGKIGELVDFVRRLHPDTHIHVSFDVDCLDPSLVPNVNTPEWSGLTVEQVLDCIEVLPYVDSMDIVEYNPDSPNALEGGSRPHVCRIVNALLDKCRAEDVELPDDYDEDDPFFTDSFQ